MQPIDVWVGERIRVARSVHGMSRAELARRIGVQIQALEKNERGETCAPLARIWAIARVLDEPIQWFFEGFGPDESPPSARVAEFFKTVTPDALDLVVEVARLTREQRRSVMDMIVALARQNEAEAMLEHRVGVGAPA